MHIITPLMSCVVNEQEFEEALKTYSDIYVITGLGKILRHIKLKEERFIRIEVKSIPGIKPEEVQPQVREEINFLPNGKIPGHLLDEVVQFFKEVMNIKKAEQEAMAHILWHKKDKDSEDRGYRIAIPNQVVGKASVRYEHDHIEKGDIIVLDIHSHNTMGAFFSGTDDSDDKKGIFFSGVAGHLNNREPEFKWRLNINETKIEADVDDIFDIPKHEIKVPTDWLDKVKTNDYSTAGYRSPGYENVHPGVFQSGKNLPPVWDGRASNGRNSSASNENWRKNSGSESSHSGGKDAGDNPTDYGYGYEYGEYSWRTGVPSLYPTSNDSPTEIAESHFPSTASTSSPEERKTDYRSPNTRRSIIQLPAPRQIQPGTMSKSEINKVNKQAKRTAVDEVDSLPLVVGHFDANVVAHGKDAADAYDQITAWLSDLENADELLFDIMARAYQMLSAGGQEKLAKEGFN